MNFKIKVFSILLLFVSFLALVQSCTTDVLQMGPNGDARLRSLSIKGVNLIPDFDPTVQNYTALVEDTTNAQLMVIPYIYFTKFTINGESLVMNTNRYGISDYTPYPLTSTNRITVRTTAEDGLSRVYTITLLDKDQVEAGLSSLVVTGGNLFPAFAEGIAPNYEVSTGSGVSNVYTLTVTNTSYSLTMAKVNAASVLTVNGSVTASGAAVPLTHPGDASTQVVMVTNISQDNSFTNIKTINVVYQDPAQDSRALDVKFYNASSGEEVTYLPTFHPGTTNYTIVLDNFSTIRMAVTAAQVGATVSVVRDSIGSGGSYTIQNTYTGAQLNSIPCEQWDRITVIIQNGTTTRYTWTVSMFNRVGYESDHKLAAFIKHIYTVTEDGYEPDDGKYFDVTGYVTFNSGLGDGFFIEDGEYGLYVWGGFDNDAYNSRPAVLIPGQKVRVRFKYAKLWQGFAEVGQDNKYKDEADKMVIVDVLDAKPRPLYYQDSASVSWTQRTDGDLSLYRHQARMFRYKTELYPIMEGFNTGFIGQFDERHAFKLCQDYGNETFSKTQSGAVKYMKEGIPGTFFGPLLYESGMYMYISHSEYIMVPWTGRAAE